MAKTTKKHLRVRETIAASKIDDAVRQLTRFLIDKFDLSKDDVALVGIQTRGAVLAHRIAKAIADEKRIELPVGEVDITLYRDDVATSGVQPVVGETRLDFDIDDKRIVLVDDVLFTGRTVRAALDELMDFGRPRSVSLLVVVERGHREMPIEALFAPIKVATKRTESVNLMLKETDGKDEIVIGEPIVE